MMRTPDPKRRKSVAYNSAIISAFSGAAIVSSLLLDVVVTMLFGVGQETDAFFIASTIPLLVYIVLKRVCEVSLVPIFVRHHAQRGPEHTGKLFSTLLNLALIFFPLLALLGAWASPLIVRIVGPGLSAEGMASAQDLSRWMFLSMGLAGPLSIVLARLNARYSFAATASTDLIRNGTAIAAVLLFHPSWGILAVGVGYLAGSIVQFLALLVVLKRQQVPYALALDLDLPGVRDALQALAWPFVSQIGRQGVEIVERMLVSYLPAGTISALKYAQRIMSALINILLSSVSSASLPLLADHLSKDNIGAFKHTLESSLKLVISLALPLSVALYVLRLPLAEFLFKRGMVTQQSVALIASLLGLYALGIPFLGAVRMLLSSFYSSHDTRTPAIHLLLMAAVNTALDVLLLQGLAAGGIALASSISAAISAIRAGWLVHRRIGRFLTSTWRFLFKLLVASAAMGAVLYLGQAALDQTRVLPETTIARALELALLGGLGLGTLLLMAYWLRIPEVLHVLSRLLRVFPLRRVDTPPGKVG
ncbi:MAG: murein biosynthesis integral membrane protein MurJ [Anaerolineae bacterium]|jgi:putative peptidoglycan lipid II flippase